VPFNSCVFAVRAEGRTSLDELERRAEALVRFYAPLGARRVQLRRCEPLGLLAGAIRFDEQDVALDRPIVWGAPPPDPLAGSDALLRASREALRAHDGAGCAIAVGPESARLVAAACTSYPLLHAASSSTARAWSSHVVAAAWLADRSPAVDPDAVPELIASEFVGSDATLIEGVRLLPPATVVDVDAAGVREGSFWPLAERWQLVPEDAAARAAGEALEASLARRVLEPPTAVGLTAGYDSRVVALALRHLGRPFFAMTAETDATDVAVAAQLADALGVEHDRRPVRWLADEDAVGAAMANVRWTDGVGRVTLGRRPPGGRPVRTLVTGAGGDVGRALAYRWVARNHRRPSFGTVRRLVEGGGHLDGMSREARALVADRRRAWLAPASELGVTGWRIMDVTYAENRLRRLYRAQSAPAEGLAVLAYATPDVQRALVSLSVEDKLSAAFYRGYVASRAPDLVPSPPASQRRGIPPAARRLAGAVRGVRRRSPRGTTSLEHPALEPSVFAWLRDALASPLIADTCGRAWADQVAARAAAGELHAIDLMLNAAAPVALDAALADLRL
jgi:hypothetical protein